MRQQEEDREVREVSETWPQVATLLFLRPAPLGAGKEKNRISEEHNPLFPFISFSHVSAHEMMSPLIVILNVSPLHSC